ncbi:hypothetical protein Vadar_002112 [Vaccinium darrowii]|uniref:Uncharacterized protein n=1 Tax=Vaccinium darrowii TaxID=229202 RepID=A0ACB7XW74_9ERIC|nr:hypothetical protein Vadar_002112 [Vaccinium darrowii]
MDQIKGLQAQGKQKIYASPGGSFESPKFTEGNGHFPTSSNMNPMLMAMIDDMVKKQIKKAKEKDDEGFRMITKPYPACVDTIPFPPGFSQPDFKMFGGTGDPRQHIAHFLSRGGPIAQNEALCLQLFVQSLEGSTFTWASQLLSQFKKVNIFHVERRINARADALASLAASLTLPDNKTITITVGEMIVLHPLKEVLEVPLAFTVTTKEEEEDW